jgi:predicted ribosome quality control (RQC) complex YloA/Tae2 family protein
MLFSIGSIFLTIYMEEDVVGTDNIYNILIGRNAQGNWDAISASDQHDIWFHIDGHPSPHIILKTNGTKLNKIEKKVIRACALKCKEYSKFVNMRKITVIYTEIKNVSKADKIGSVHTKNLRSIVI